MNEKNGCTDFRSRAVRMLMVVFAVAVLTAGAMAQTPTTGALGGTVTEFIQKYGKLVVDEEWMDMGARPVEPGGRAGLGGNLAGFAIHRTVHQSRRGALRRNLGQIQRPERRTQPPFAL